ncbi:MAG: FtsX-like permease family protein [Bryobacterales bacterium]|nr:FtsX-like permease family protein [Bryobacterales bacterium]
MASLALRNLLHDKVRLAVTLVGIVFALVLIVVQLGLFLGFTTVTSAVIDHSGADLWVTAVGMQNLDVGVPFHERKLYQVRADSAVARSEKYIVQFATWKRPDGLQESVEVVGFEPRDGMGGPWNLIEGDLAVLLEPDTVIIDEFYKSKLGVRALGEVVEINGRRARVAGFTRGIRSFTTSPHAFTSFKNALTYTGLAEDQTVFVLVKAAPGADVVALQQRLRDSVADVDVFTTAEFSKKTQDYWLYTTGAGVTVLIAAAMGLIVGLVVVAQTIYATTMDHIREFGTLKAMGASNGYIYRVILEQAGISAVLGYLMAMAISIPVVRASQNGSALILLPPELAASIFVLAVVMCTTASVVSIRKVTSIDPAMVFKG